MYVCVNCTATWNMHKYRVRLCILNTVLIIYIRYLILYYIRVLWTNRLFADTSIRMAALPSSRGRMAQQGTIRLYRVSQTMVYGDSRGALRKKACTANPRDICIFNKDVKGVQITIAVYVDDLLMTSKNKRRVLETEQLLLSTYGQFRILHD